MRGVWVDGFGPGFRTPGEVEELIAFAIAARLDALVIQVTRRGDTLANHLPLPRVVGPGIEPAPFDPLAAVCEAAGPAGIAVHAWLGVTPAAARGADPDPALVPLLSRRHDGSDRDGHGLPHLDPGHPGTAEHLAHLAALVAERYPVDGLNLDRIRYPESPPGTIASWGHNPDALARFRSDTGADAPTQGPAWQAWRRQQVTALVSEVVSAVRAVRPEVTCSTTGVCFGGLEQGWEGSRAWVDLGQDWVGWLDQGVVDRVLAMNYRGDADDADLVSPGFASGTDLSDEGAVAGLAEPAALDRRFHDWAELAVRAGGRRAVIGSGWYLRDVDTSAAQAQRAGDLAAGGWCGFSFRNPTAQVLAGAEEPTAGRDRLAAALAEVPA